MILEKHEHISKIDLRFLPRFFIGVKEMEQSQKKGISDYTWATILAFSSKDHLDAWLSRRNLTAGYAMPIQKCWELAQRQYAGRLDYDWQRPNQAETQQFFDKLGLKGKFWDLGGTNWVGFPYSHLIRSEVVSTADITTPTMSHFQISNTHKL